MTTLAFARLLAASTLAAGLLAPLSASAKTCNADAECNTNQKCEIVGSSGFEGCPPCPAGAACEPCAPPEPTTLKECVDQPIACTSDADCPSYLSCEEEMTPEIGCAACPPGSDCPPCAPPPQPSGKKICSYVERKCTTDADCGAGFSCQTSEMGTCSGAAPTCPPNQDCPPPPDPECTTEKISRCELKIVACKQNSDCAQDFSCETITEGSCTDSGGGGTRPGGDTSSPPSAGGGSDPAPPEPSPAPQDGDDPDGSCVTTTRQICIPKGIGFGSSSNDSASGGGIPRASGESSSTGKGNPLGGNPAGANTEGTQANASNDDGCSTAGAGRNGGAAWSLLLVAAACLGLGKRRRASLSQGAARSRRALA